MHFVLWTLDEHSEELISELQQQIARLKLRREGNLEDSFDAHVYQSGNDWVLQLSFRGYGRAIEIRYHKRSKNTSRWQATKTNELLWERGNRAKVRRHKDTRWYSKTTYGMLNELIAKLSYGLTEEVKAMLRADLERARDTGDKHTKWNYDEP